MYSNPSSVQMDCRKVKKGGIMKMLPFLGFIITCIDSWLIIYMQKQIPQYRHIEGLWLNYKSIAI